MGEDANEEDVEEEEVEEAPTKPKINQRKDKTKPTTFPKEK